MFIYYKDSKSGKSAVVYDLDLIPSELKNILGNRWAELFNAIGECEIPAPQGYDYFAWITEPSGYISIRYAGKKNPYSEEQQYEGIFVMGFNGPKVNPEEVPDFIRERIPASLVDTAKVMMDALEILIK